MEILRYLKYSKKPEVLQRLLDLSYYNPSTFILNKELVSYLRIKGFDILPSENLDSFKVYPGWLEGTKPTDIAVDIGACIGGITLPLSKLVKEVHAFEPLYKRELDNNIAINNISNIKTYKEALGNLTGKEIEISFGSKKEKSLTISWKTLKSNIPQIDFLKIDIEGFEWEVFKPKDFKDIRELRLELHILYKGRTQLEDKASSWINELESMGYRCRTLINKEFSPSIHHTIYLWASGTKKYD